MQYDDGANRTTDSDLDDADRSAIDESEVAQPDEQAAATDARGGSDKVWQGVQPVGGTEAVPPPGAALAQVIKFVADA